MVEHLDGIVLKTTPVIFDNRMSGRCFDVTGEEDKQIVEKELKMLFNYEELIQDDPVVQNLLAERELKGNVEGEIKARKESILSLLTARFSSALAAQAQPAIAPIDNAETLKMLFQLLLRIPDEQAVRAALDLPSE